MEESKKSGLGKRIKEILSNKCCVIGIEKSKEGKAKSKRKAQPKELLKSKGTPPAKEVVDLLSKDGQPPEEVIDPVSNGGKSPLEEVVVAKECKATIIPFPEKAMDLVSKIPMIRDGAGLKELFLFDLLLNANRALFGVRLASLVDNIKYGAKIKYGDVQALEIHIIPDLKTNTLSIVDNGIGMTGDDLPGTLLSVVRHRLDHLDNHMQAIKKYLRCKDGVDLSRFYNIDRWDVRLGFCSAFMVAHKVVVTTRKAGHDPYVCEFIADDKGGSTVSVAPLGLGGDGDGDSFDQRGTKVTLHLKEGQHEYLKVHKLQELVNKCQQEIDFYPVILLNNENKDRMRLNVDEEEEEEDSLEKLQEEYKSIRDLFDKHIRDKVKNIDVVITDRAGVFSNLNMFAEDGKPKWEINPRCDELEEFRKLVDTGYVNEEYKEDLQELVKFWNQNDESKVEYEEMVNSDGDEKIKDEALKVKYVKYKIDEYFEDAKSSIRIYDMVNGTSFYKQALKSLQVGGA